MRFLVGIAALAGGLAFALPARAVVIMVDQPQRFTGPDVIQVFSGRITNDTGAALTAQDVFLNFSGFDPAALSFDQLLGLTDFAIPDGATTADVPLFDVNVGAVTAAGTPYLADVQAQDGIDDLSNVVTIRFDVPAPAGMALPMVALALTLGGLVPRRRTAKAALLAAAAMIGAGGHPAQAQVSPVKLGTGLIGSSVWDDGTISLAVPLYNTGSATAANVQVRTIALKSLALAGTRADEALLPEMLGTIVGSGNAVLNTRFTGLPYAVSYLLTVSGTYEAGGTTRGFSVNAWVMPRRASNGTTPAQTSTVTKKYAPLFPLPPATVGEDDDKNPPGPPIPVGPPIRLVPVPPTSTPVQPESGSASVTFYHDTRNSQSVTGWPPDPEAVSGSNVVLATGNTYLRLSTDGGTTFTNVDPTTIFPQSDGGLCCDQVVTYVPSVNLFFWLLQYKQTPVAPVPPATSAPQGPNRLRIAYATPAAVAANVTSAWTYVDLTTGTLGQNGAGQWLDFPDMAFTDAFLYVGVDSVGSGLIVSRMALSELSNPSLTTINVGYLSPNELSDQSFGNMSRLTQSSTDAMYWAAHQDTTKLEVFRWPDSSGSVTHVVSNTNTYCGADYSSLAPDGQQWIDNSRRNGTGAVLSGARIPFQGLVAPGATRPNGQVWFAWGAARDDATCKNGRPQPYVYIAQMDDQTLAQVGEYDIWNASNAFAYPALATDPINQVGVALAWGGPSNFGSTAAGYLGDFVVYYNEPSGATIFDTHTDAKGNLIVDSAGNAVEFTRFGDWFDVRRSGANSDRFSSLGYSVQLIDPKTSTSCLQNNTNCTFAPHYIEWGRPAGPPPTPIK